MHQIKFLPAVVLLLDTLKKGVILYEDIPYAEPPIGDLRWKALVSYQEEDNISPKNDNFCLQDHLI